MTFAIHEGVWPVMITPWKEDNTPDFKALEALTNWYVEKGCDGIFAVCQSSEMHYLPAPGAGPRLAASLHPGASVHR